MDITATKRSVSGKGLEALRTSGKIPAVVYGPKQEPVSITLDRRDFEKVFKAAGESTVVTIALDGTQIPALIHDVDHDPVTNVVRHADFYAIVKGQKVKVQIPLEFVGDAPAAKAGANIVKTMYEIEVEADPMNLPHNLEVDLTVLTEVGAQVLASDIKLPAGVTLETDGEEVVALATQANEEVLDEPVAAVDMTQIGTSVERGKKEEEEGEAAA
ncbi:MAG: 50S ribosomal protein L25 [Candidatus Pacebacteria bacterium]|nr:50S ribosomal protein L25 [Candidatus Paceibacterota bacterium]